MLMLIQSTDGDFSVVFVHGLNGDRLATWTKDKVCWPRDLLKEDMPNSRIMSVSLKLLSIQHRRSDIWQWGYDANVMKFLDAAGQSSVAALALQLLEDVARRRRTGEEVGSQSELHEAILRDCRCNGQSCLLFTAWEV